MYGVDRALMRHGKPSGRAVRHAVFIGAVLMLVPDEAAACFYHARGLNTKDPEQTSAEKLLGGAYAPGDRKREREHYQAELLRMRKEAPSRRADLDFLDEYAYVLHRNGQDSQAEEVWAEILKKEPKRFSTLCNSGTVSQIRGRTAEALKHLNEAAKQRPDFRGGAERWHVRMIEYQARQASRPGYSRSHLFIDELSLLWFKRNGTDPLAKFPIEVTSSGIAELLREFPTFADGWLVLGMALENEGNAYTALAAYDRALKLGTTHRPTLEPFLKAFREKAAAENPARQTARAMVWTLIGGGAIALLLLGLKFGNAVWSDVREAREQNRGGAKPEK